jgi:hypothetical protein
MVEGLGDGWGKEKSPNSKLQTGRKSLTLYLKKYQYESKKRP